MTKAQIQKIAKANNIDISLVNIYKYSGTLRFEMAELPADLMKRNLESEGFGNIPEVEKLIKAYNRQVNKLLKFLKGLGEKYWGFKRGSGDWEYELGSKSYSTELAFANID
jgi:hypothetical protein